jgi:uncharacterized protein (DUF1800 family)
MKLTRGQFIGMTAAAVGGASLTGCAEVARRVSTPELPKRIGQAEAAAADPAWRLLNRAAFGPRPGDLERVREMGVDVWLEEQLSPETIEERWAAWVRLMPMDTLDMGAMDAEDLETAVYPEVGKGQAAVELQTACLLRAVYSARQLQEVMVEFWTDHFNVSQLKAECSWLKTMDDRLVRKHAMGKFRDLVSASAHSPAMLFYLDNDKNRKLDPKTKSGTNENYARELLELHTLGVDGGYSLKDIQEVARCFSGWSYKKGFTLWPGDFAFNKQFHDDGPKRILGQVIPGGQGIKDGEQVIDLLCEDPHTARFVARKLCRRFVADRGPESLEKRLAETFQKTDGDIKQVLSVLFRSDEFRKGEYVKFKRPFDFTVSALRAVNADTTGEAVLPYLERMGQLPYKWTMPDGYPDRMEAWTPSLLARWNFTLDLVQNEIGGTSVDAEALAKATGTADPAGVVAGLSRAVLGEALPEKQVKKLAALGGETAARTRQCLALLLAAPQFQWR